MSKEIDEQLAKILDEYEEDAYNSELHSAFHYMFSRGEISLPVLDRFNEWDHHITVKKMIEELRKSEPTEEEKKAKQAEMDALWASVDANRKRVHDLFASALTTEGAHHKQWYIWQIAKEYGVKLSDVDADKGIKP